MEYTAVPCGCGALGRRGRGHFENAEAQRRGGRREVCCTRHGLPGRIEFPAESTILEASPFAAVAIQELRMQRRENFFAFLLRDKVIHFLVGERGEPFGIEPAFHAHFVGRIHQPDQVNRHLSLRPRKRLPRHDVADDINLIFHRETVVELFNPERKFVVHADDFLIGNEHGRESREMCAEFQDFQA